MFSGRYLTPLQIPIIYDGYIAGEGNKEQIDNEDVPFVTTTGTLDGDAVPCMVLFTKKGETMTKQLMWECHHGQA